MCAACEIYREIDELVDARIARELSKLFKPDEIATLFGTNQNG